ncbi:ExbD/TolR family protein [Shimia biformata]|uniref:ExbD/TolR family protein n=1 Tax=Shimia biformata TaxID=1294299 RepID=UPI001951BA75|nr:biopolymer transporter ExbD [Shimia biformata]
MDFAPPPKRPRSESIVPMINVVFLLLIFFLMTSELTQPAPVDVRPPSAGQSTDPLAEVRIHVDTGGQLYFQDFTGDGALIEAARMAQADPQVLLTADANIEATRLAAILSRLAAAGLSRVELVVTAR